MDGVCEMDAVDNRFVFKVDKKNVECRTKFLKSCIVRRFIGDGGSIPAIKRWASKVWGINTGVKIHVLSNGLMLFCLPSEEVVTRILNKGRRSKRGSPLFSIDGAIRWVALVF